MFEMDLSIRSLYWQGQTQYENLWIETSINLYTSTKSNDPEFRWIAVKECILIIIDNAQRAPAKVDTIAFFFCYRSPLVLKINIHIYVNIYMYWNFVVAKHFWTIKESCFHTGPNGAIYCRYRYFRQGSTKTRMVQ